MQFHVWKGGMMIPQIETSILNTLALYMWHKLGYPLRHGQNSAPGPWIINPRAWNWWGHLHQMVGSSKQIFQAEHSPKKT